MRTLIFILLISALLSAGCSENHSKSKELTAKVYVDLLVAKEKYYHRKDSLQLAQDSIFKKYNLAKPDYEKNLEMLKHNNEEWNDFFKYAESYIDTLKSREAKDSP